MILGSHNTLTYLPPRKWWMYLLIPFARCQNSSSAEACPCVDVRVKYIGEGKWVYAHGLYEVYKPMDYIQVVNDCSYRFLGGNVKYLRLTLESSSPNIEAENIFRKMCILMETEMFKQGIEVFGGTRKFDWKLIYKFKANPEYEQWVGSMQSTYGKVFPFLWNFFNPICKLKVKYDTIVLKDFIK